jgi:hypothetical protein
MEQQHREKLRRRGRTQQSGQEQIMGKSGQEQITLHTGVNYRAVTSPPRIPGENSAGSDKRIVFIDPSFTAGDYNAGGGRWTGPCMMYPKEYKNIVS